MKPKKMRRANSTRRYFMIGSVVEESIMVFLVIELILVAISIIVANKMIKKRIWFTKRMVIGKESDAKVEKMKQVAENLLSKEITDSELGDLTINVKINDGKIVETKVESAETIVLSSNEYGTRTFNLAWTKRGAVAVTAFTLWVIALWLQFIITLLYYAYMSANLLPQ